MGPAELSGSNRSSESITIIVYLHLAYNDTANTALGTSGSGQLWVPVPKFEWLQDLAESLMLTNEDWPSLAWTITTKHQILMTGDSRRGKSIWPTAHHLRGCSIVPVYTVQCRILLPNHKVAVSLLKRIALLVGPWPTPRITQGNTRSESSRCLETWQSAPVKYSMVSHGHTIPDSSH